MLKQKLLGALNLADFQSTCTATLASSVGVEWE